MTLIANKNNAELLRNNSLASSSHSQVWTMVRLDKLAVSLKRLFICAGYSCAGVDRLVLCEGATS